jgi:hypothetical protein
MLRDFFSLLVLLTDEFHKISYPGFAAFCSLRYAVHGNPSALRSNWL